MRLLIQRVKRAEVRVDEKIVGQIKQGLLVFLGITHEDSQETLLWCKEKLLHLRIFEDEAGKMNHSLLDVNGQVLLVSQFTLYGDTKRGRRPDFMKAARPEVAQSLYQQMVVELKNAGVVVETGVFGAMMDVELVNDGPVTLLVERENGL
jgi:D-tyrosyl-tRNA(Tyr) deacylase